MATGSGLLVPHVPMSYCTMCGEEFPLSADDALRRHVEVCYRKHEDELGEERLEREKPMWDHDQERYEWLRSGRKP